MLRLAAVLCALVAPAVADTITAARYTDPTTRYPHGVLGDTVEYGALELDTSGGKTVRIVLPETRVFEDTEPRLHDLDGDGAPEVIVAESDARLGGRLAVYGAEGLIAAAPFIGTRFRWLGIAGAADLDGDGAIEIAYVDRPHLAKTLRVFRYRDGALSEIAKLRGVSNHRIGERDIAGGIRNCGTGPEIIVADSAWSEVRAVRLTDGRLSDRRLFPHEDRQSFARAMACRD